jgi:hypothetical protein
MQTGAFSAEERRKLVLAVQYTRSECIPKAIYRDDD